MSKKSVFGDEVALKNVLGKKTRTAQESKKIYFFIYLRDYFLSIFIIAWKTPIKDCAIKSFLGRVSHHFSLYYYGFFIRISKNTVIILTKSVNYDIIVFWMQNCLALKLTFTFF